MVKTIRTYLPEMDAFNIKPGDIDEFLDYPTLFGNDNPVEIEIGMGKGRFILAESHNRPNTNFIGIERSLKWFRVALLRLTQNPRPNCKLLCWDADMIVKLLIKPKSVFAYHVYFPDPWPKDRHQKRRLLNPRFIEKIAETLVPQGKLYLKTDHEDYYRDTHSAILSSNLLDTYENFTTKPLLTDFTQAQKTDAVHNNACGMEVEVVIR